jgi:ABC-type lipoprotein export system ATPase subunit
MQLLAALNASRKLTLIVVTHNKAVAAGAGRRVAIVDGKLLAAEVPNV